MVKQLHKWPIKLFITLNLYKIFFIEQTFSQRPPSRQKTRFPLTQKRCISSLLTHAVQLDSSQTRKPLFWGFLAEISMFLDISNMPGQENDAQDI